MGVIQKDAFRTTIISYIGLVLGYVNKGVLFILFLSTEEIGLINLLVSVGTLLGNLSGLGSSFAIWKFFPFLRNPQKKHHGLLLLTLFISLIGGFIFTVLVLLFKQEIIGLYKDNSAPFVSYYFWIIPLSFATLLFLVFDSFLRSLYYNVISVLVYELLLRLLITVLLVLYGLHFMTFNVFLTVHCLIYFIPVIALILFMKRKGEFSLSLKHLSIPKRFRKIIVSFGLMSYINSVGNLFVITLDVMMIASFLGLKATGVYSTIIYLTNALQIPYKSMLRVASPIVSDQWKERNLIEMSKLYKKFSSVSLVIVSGMFLAIWICREEIFQLLPKDFHEGIWVFLFLMIGRFSDMYFGLNGVILYMSKKYKYDILFTLFLIGVVWILNLFLIPWYGISGAAIATGFAFVIYNLGRVIFVYKAYKMHPFEREQLTVIALFVAVLIGFEYLPLWKGIDPVMSAVVKWGLLGIVFAMPIYFFKLNHDIVGYVDNGLSFLKKKISRRKLDSPN